MKMYDTSDITGKTYETNDVHYFRNPLQSAYYLSWGGPSALVDLFVDGQNKLVFVFEKSTHNKFKERWHKHCEQWNEEQKALSNDV